MNAEDYGKTIEAAAIDRDGKKVLPCAVAFQLAGDHGVPLKDIGTYCTDAGIKIVGCQLGCFE
jgi:hypothetical protein